MRAHVPIALAAALATSVAVHADVRPTHSANPSLEAPPAVSRLDLVPPAVGAPEAAAAPQGLPSAPEALSAPREATVPAAPSNWIVRPALTPSPVVVIESADGAVLLIRAAVVR